MAFTRFIGTPQNPKPPTSKNESSFTPYRALEASVYIFEKRNERNLANINNKRLKCYNSYEDIHIIILPLMKKSLIIAESKIFVS